MAIDRRTARLGMLVSVSLVMLAILATRLWFLQGVQQEQYEAAVNASRTRTETLPAMRGRIFDADGRILADNRNIRTLTVEWRVLLNKKNRNILLPRLAKAFGVTELSLQQRFEPCYGMPKIPKCTARNPYSTLSPMPMIENVSEEQINYVFERREDFPGVDVTVQSERRYAYAPLASHVVGFMGVITKESWPTYRDKGYIITDRVGQFGVELSMEEQLRGKPGERVVEIDAMGNVIRVVSETPPVPGNDIQLSIDLDLQQYAEQALQTQLRMRRNLPYSGDRSGAPRNPIDKTTGRPTFFKIMPDGSKRYYPAFVPYKAPAGAVVVQSSVNGQVLAMASYPTFDNRWFGGGVTGAKLSQIFPSAGPNGEKLDPDKSTLVNRAVQARYNLGSSIKPFIAWSALHSGVIMPNTGYLDTGSYTLRGIDTARCIELGAKCAFTNAKNRMGIPTAYGWLTVESALAVSSDAFFYKIGEDFFELGRSVLKNELEKFGFGNKTGVELPFEWKGSIPDDQLKADLVASGVLREGEVPYLTVGDNVQVAIGQGLMAATPLQLANAYATIGNSGKRLQPTVVKAIFLAGVPDKGPAMVDISKGVKVLDHEVGTVVEELEMSEGIRGPIERGLRRVITGPGANSHGTTGMKLFNGFPRDIGLHGKTGTVQGAGSFPWNDSSAFGSFSSNPLGQYAVVGYLEKSGYGSQAAGPVVKCMYSALFNKVTMDPVVISDPLDITSNVPAPAVGLRNTGCLSNGGITLRD